MIKHFEPISFRKFRDPVAPEIPTTCRTHQDCVILRVYSVREQPVLVRLFSCCERGQDAVSFFFFC